MTGPSTKRFLRQPAIALMALACMTLAATAGARQPAAGGGAVAQTGEAGRQETAARSLEYYAVKEDGGVGGQGSGHWQPYDPALVKTPGALPFVIPRDVAIRASMRLDPPIAPEARVGLSADESNNSSISSAVRASETANTSISSAARAAETAEPGIRPEALAGEPSGIADAVPHGPPTVSGEQFLSIGGFPVLPGQVPWQAQIYQPWEMQKFVDAGKADGRPLWALQHLCGGTLIAPNWVLSAAHCLDEHDGGKGYRVRLGATRIDVNEGSSYTIDRVVRHPNYRDQPGGTAVLNYDIALIHFVQATPPPVGRAVAIEIDRGAPPADNATVYATGWGRTSNTSATSASVLMRVELKNVAMNRCSQMWGISPQDKALCAGAQGKQTCQGDSGGPLVVNLLPLPPRVIGVVSWNFRNCIGDASKPGYYSRVASYAGWIDGVMADR